MLAQTTESGATAAGLFGGVSEAGSPVIPGNDQLLFWATEAQNRLCRLCLPIQDYAAAQPAYAGAQTLAAYTQLTTPSGRQLFTASDVYLGSSKRLQPASAGYSRAQNWYPPDLEGNPTAWTNLGSGIGLSGYTTRPWFTINGYAIPAPLTALTQQLDENIDDYAQIAMWAYVAWRLALSNQDNTVLASRAAWCMSEFISTLREIYTRLIGNDSNLSAGFVATDIDAQVAIMKQEMPNQ